MQKNISYLKADAEGIANEFNDHLRLKYSKGMLLLQSSAGDGIIKPVALRNGMIAVLINARFKGKLRLYNKFAKSGHYILNYVESISEKETVKTTTRFFLSMADDSEFVELQQGTKTKLVQVIFKPEHLYQYIPVAKVKVWLEEHFSHRHTFQELPDIFIRIIADELLQTSYRQVFSAQRIQTRCMMLFEKFLEKTYPGKDYARIKKVDAYTIDALIEIESQLYTNATKHIDKSITAADIDKYKVEFKTLYNVPLTAYAHQYKLLKALQLLATGEHDMNVITSIIGFTKQQLVDEFKKNYDVSLTDI